MNDRIRQLLRELGIAINESISSSEEVNQQIQKLRDEGYDLYVVLDATIGLNKNDEDEVAEIAASAPVIARGDKDVQFRINVNDLAWLRNLGIDPTRKVKGARRVERIGQLSDER